jgi:hypothetical protein
MQVAAASCRWNLLSAHATPLPLYVVSMLGIFSDRVKQKSEIILAGFFRRTACAEKNGLLAIRPVLRLPT